MKPIGNWTDAELRSEQAWGSPHAQDLADEVLRLRQYGVELSVALAEVGERRREDFARAEKAEADLAAARAAGRDDAVELLACPKCGAAPGEPCTTGGYLPVGDLPGDARPEGPHKQRQVWRETDACVRCGGEGPFNSQGWCQGCASPGYI